MTHLKTDQEIAIMQEGGRKLRQILETVIDASKPGVTKARLDKLAESEIKKSGGEPSFKMVPGYSWSSCLTINNEVVHGIPGETELRSGDILGIDLGIFYKGFHTDMATTIPVGDQATHEEFLKVGRDALEAAIKKAKAGNHVGDLSLAIQQEVERGGYSPVRVLTGHGIGKTLHEGPAIPCFLEKQVQTTPKLEVGMTLAIEVIYNQGGPNVVLTDDGWTIVTEDGKISGVFEETVAIMEDRPLVLTR